MQAIRVEYANFNILRSVLGYGKTQPSPQTFSARSFLDSTMSCILAENA